MYVFPCWSNFRSSQLDTSVTGCLWLCHSHLHCVSDSSGHGPRTLCRHQNSRKTTVGRIVPSLPCLTWKSCLSLIRSNTLGPKRGESYIKSQGETPKGYNLFFFVGVKAGAYLLLWHSSEHDWFGKGKSFPLNSPYCPPKSRGARRPHNLSVWLRGRRNIQPMFRIAEIWRSSCSLQGNKGTPIPWYADMIAHGFPPHVCCHTCPCVPLNVLQCLHAHHTPVDMSQARPGSGIPTSSAFIKAYENMNELQ